MINGCVDSEETKRHKAKNMRYKSDYARHIIENKKTPGSFKNEMSGVYIFVLRA